MTTPNGHEEPDIGAESEQVTSTVLALDGWGPVVPEPATNGTNGVEADTAVRDEPEAVVEVEPEDDLHRDAWRERLQQSLHGSPSLPSVDSQLLRILASAAAMSIAVFVGHQPGPSIDDARHLIVGAVGQFRRPPSPAGARHRSVADHQRRRERAGTRSWQSCWSSKIASATVLRPRGYSCVASAWRRSSACSRSTRR